MASRPVAQDAWFLRLILGFLASCACEAQPTPQALWARSAGAPAENPPALVADVPAPGVRSPAHLAGPSVYSIGDPTDEEQFYVELLNRARANPQAEAARYAASADPDVLNAYHFFSVDLSLMLSQFSVIAAAPPVSIHPLLTAAARAHTQDMFEHSFQDHPGTDGSTTGTRITKEGYVWQVAGENIFISATGVWYGHVAFDVDWGSGPGGMQTPPGHRKSIHNAAFREVGVGVILGQNGKAGPQVVTQDFATSQTPGSFITGVVYFDFNGNNFYDPGEGIGGVTVRVAGVPAYSVTARSGGYSVPVSDNGTYSVTFEVPGLAPVTREATVRGLANVKLDHLPTYSPPVIGGASVATVGEGHVYPFGPVPAATAYEWQWLTRQSWADPEGAESGLGRIVADVSPGYSVVVSDVRSSGAAAFHLAHPVPKVDQFLTLRNPILLGVASELSFSSRLGLAGTVQVAHAQISADNGATWDDLWSQRGTGDKGELAFARRVLPLAGYAGKSVLIRFGYLFLNANGGYFPQTSSGAGFYIDDIQVSDSEFLGDATVAATDSASFTFQPSAVGSYALQVRAKIGDRTLSWGPALLVTAVEGVPLEPPVVRLGGLSANASGGWDLAFRLEKGVFATLGVVAADSVEGPWVSDPSVSISDTGAGSYRAVIPARAGVSRFLRIVTR